MTNPIARLLLAPVLAAVLSCGPPMGEVPRDLQAEAERFADAFCSERKACGCDDARFSSTDACELEIAAEFMTQVDRGLTLNTECFDALLTSEAMTCATWPWDHKYWECASLQGSSALGEPCLPHSQLSPLWASDCADGMLCQRGVCALEYDYATFPAIGEPCVRDGVADCEFGSYCGSDDICHADSELGEPCTHQLACGGAYFCDGLADGGVGVCAERIELGEPCDPRAWHPCAFPPSAPPWTWCASPSHTCALNQPGLCLLSYPVLY